VQGCKASTALSERVSIPNIHQRFHHLYQPTLGLQDMDNVTDGSMD
jgi:hypothetical protein